MYVCTAAAAAASSNCSDVPGDRIDPCDADKGQDKTRQDKTDHDGIGQRALPKISLATLHRTTSPRACKSSSLLLLAAALSGDQGGVYGLYVCNPYIHWHIPAYAVRAVLLLLLQGRACRQCMYVPYTHYRSCNKKGQPRQPLLTFPGLGRE
jgi:hypothetical protein